jgi:dihydroflavonol-4-reductase
MWSVHVEGTRTVLAAADPGARIIHTSSITTLGSFAKPKCVNESMAWNRAAANVPYVQAKRAAERLALDAVRHGRDVVVTNPGYLVGPEDHEQSLMGRLCARFWRGRAPLAPPGGINVVDVRDAAEGHVLAAEKGVSGERYLLGGANLTCADFFRLLAQAADYRPRALARVPWIAFAALAWLAEARAGLTGNEPYPSLAHATMNHYYWFGTSAKAERELGYRARPAQETVADTYRWHAARRGFRLRGFNRWWFRPGERKSA